VRERFNWKKQLKTRWTLFNVQRRHFIGSGQIRFALLSLAVFSARIANDLIRLIGHSFAGPALTATRDESPESVRWRRVLETIRGKP
jgi:hypothetical protein